MTESESVVLPLDDGASPAAQLGCEGREIEIARHTVNVVKVAQLALDGQTVI